LVLVTGTSFSRSGLAVGRATWAARRRSGRSHLEGEGEDLAQAAPAANDRTTLFARERSAHGSAE
jgi:hypothetical protein